MTQVLPTKILHLVPSNLSILPKYFYTPSVSTSLPT
jgi:hypothetical protein